MVDWLRRRYKEERTDRGDRIRRRGRDANEGRRMWPERDGEIGRRGGKHGVLWSNGVEQTSPSCLLVRSAGKRGDGLTGRRAGERASGRAGERAGKGGERARVL